MSTLSTCGTCGGTIEHRAVPAGSGVAAFWQHVVPTLSNSQHRPDPDDSAVSGPSHDDVCDGDCDDCQEAEA